MIILKAVLYALAALILLALFYVLVLYFSGLFVDETHEYSKDSPYFRFLLNFGMWCATFFAGVKLRIVGKEKLPQGRFLIVGNHRSNFDPIVTWCALRNYNISYISKQGNFNLPFCGRILRRCCCMEIDRHSPRHSFETIERAAELIKSGEVSVGVYPEGTRSHDGKLLPFHNGVFKIAQIADVPIVVICSQGTENIHKNFPLRRTKVTLTITDVLPAEFVKEHKTSYIGERVRKSLSQCLGQ